MKNRYIGILICAVALGFIAFLAFPLVAQSFGFFTWSQINCTEEFVDIFSGDVRTERWYWYRLISADNRESEISGFAPPTDREKFVCVNTFSFRAHHSPHYGYHAAFYQTSILVKHWENIAAPDEVRRQHTAGLLAAWQAGNGDVAAYAYLDSIGVR